MEIDKGQSTRPRIAFLGLGRMGAPMAANLAKAGHDLIVWNRTPEKADPLSDLGAVVATSAADAASGADIVITMLQSDAAVRSVLFDAGVADAAVSGTKFVDMSTIPPHSAIEHARELEDRGIGWLDAPVSGGTRGATNGTLTIMIGGHAETFEQCAPVLTTMGRVTHIGPPGAGQVAKIANQIIVATSIGGVAEALLLTSAAGLDPAIVRGALNGGFADSRILTEHGRRMVERDFVPGGSVDVQLKDLNIALGEASELGLRLPLTEKVSAMFQSMADLGSGDVDHSALIVELERMNNGQGQTE